MASPPPSPIPPWEAGLSALAGLALLSLGVASHTVHVGHFDAGELLGEPLVWALGLALPLFTGLGWVLGERRRERSRWFDEVQATTRRGMRDLAQREWLVRGILQTAFDAMLVVDDDQVIIDANPIATRIFGYPLEDLIGSPIERVLPERQQLGTTLAIERRTAGGEVLGKEWQTRAQHRTGHRFPVDLNLVAMREPGLMVYVVREATTRVRAEQKRLDDMRAELLGRTSAQRQERSTRLLALGDAVRSEIDRMLVPLERHGDAMERDVAEAAYLILERLEKLHQLSMWEQLTQAATLAPTPMEPLVNGVIEALRPMALRHGNRLRLVLDPDVDGLITDGPRLSSALRALVANAAMHCRDADITVQVTREPGRQVDWIAFYVQDTGHGLEPGELDRLYQLFGADPDQLVLPKEGLGFALAHRQARSLDGHLSVSSDTGGCTVTLRVPESRSTRRDPATPAPLRLHSGS